MKVACLLILMAGFPAGGTATPGQEGMVTMTSPHAYAEYARPLPLAYDEALLEYHIKDTLLTIRAFARDSVSRVVQRLPALFWRSLEQFRRRLASADPSDIMATGEVLYRFLAGPVEKIITGKRRLIIVAGRPLYGLPFEALARCTACAKAGGKEDLHYLVRDFEFIYHRSLAEWVVRAGTGIQRSRGGLAHDGYDLTGCSPHAYRNSCGTGLPCSGHEIRAIDLLFRQSGLSCSVDSTGRWSRDIFSSAASSGRIVHLAAHAVPYMEDGCISALLFTDQGESETVTGLRNSLFAAEEISAMKLDADLVVLNACETYGARENPDTSDITLPQLFSRAGARNVIYTLWNVADRPAELFMIDFYRVLLTGKSCGEALREVKLQWISRRETRLPFLWAVYVLTGSG